MRYVTTMKMTDDRVTSRITIGHIISSQTTVLSMTLSLVHHHEIKQEHFAAAEDEDTPGIFLTREGRAIFLRAYEKKMRAASRYGCGDGKRSYRHALAYQTRQYAQALMAENADIYEPVRLR